MFPTDYKYYQTHIKLLTDRQYTQDLRKVNCSYKGLAISHKYTNVLYLEEEVVINEILWLTANVKLAFLYFFTQKDGRI